MSEVLINRVTESALTSLDLEELGGMVEVMVFDLKPFLFMELILKEKDYREALRQHDWSVYAGKLVTIQCSADAIIPMWANMLAAIYLEPVALGVVYGEERVAREKWLLQKVAEINTEDYRGKRVVLKGCGDEPVSEAVYVAITAKLRPVVKSIMYGEPCSTVPIYKEKKG
jgi:hypothetical protein